MSTQTMNNDTLWHIQLPKSQFKPNEMVSGQIQWRLPHSPEAIDIYLAWQTDGKGTQDSKKEINQILQAHLTHGEANFSLKLPHAPYSFSGKLIHLQWYVEAKSKHGKHEHRVSIEVGPEAEKIDLDKKMAFRA